MKLIKTARHRGRRLLGHRRRRRKIDRQRNLAGRVRTRRPRSPIDSFEKALSVPVEDIEIELRGFAPIPWDDYWLNPRRLRGSDFLMRWSQGVWSERRIVQAFD